MKKYIFILLALVTVVSCNDKAFLEERTYNDDTGSFFKNQNAIEIALASAYSEVQYMVFGNQRGGSEHNWMLFGLGLDTFSTTGANTQFSNWETMTAESGYARHYGEYMYKLSNRANIVVDMIDEHPEIEYSSATMKQELRAEAVFLRAWAFRVVTGMFGQVVYAKHMTQEARYDYTMNTRQEAWELLAEDFAYAEANLPKTPRLMGTVTKAAAAHYLAETYLCLGEFDKAEQAATRVIDGTDGDYHLMMTRFGNRKADAVDRYGNSLAAPQGAYWDLFRSSAMSDGKFASDSNPNDPDNKEAIWVAQIDYESGNDVWPLGGSGDSWWRMHKPVLESTFAPWVPMGGKNGTRKGTDDVTYYVFTADAVCFPAGVAPDGAGTPADNIPEAAGRKLAYPLSTKIDSIAVRAQGNGAATSLGLLPSEWVQRPAGDINGSYWNDPNDFRGSEIMVQRDYYTPSGKKWSEVKANVKARVAAGLYNVTAADTVNITPRFWKFSDDKHPSKSTGVYYDCDWYMIRIAETYLLRAEAYLGLGDKNNAANDINVLRNRAGAKPVAAGDVDIDYIMDERVRELFGEEQRWITLNRLTCNPKATYVLEKYPTQNTTTTNYMYERVHKYGFGYEGAPGAREAYTDIYGKTRHYSNFQPHNYVFPIPTQIIQSNKDVEIPQNDGY